MTVAPEVRKLASEISTLKRQVRERTPQLAFTALEDGAIREFDVDGTQTAQYGKQFDGASMANSLVGPLPPVPAGISLLPIPGGLKVIWDGTFEDDAIIPTDWSRAEIYVANETGFDSMSAINFRTTIESPRGGEVDIFLAPEPQFVVLVGRTLSGNRSAASVEVSATPLSIMDGEAVLEAIAESANGLNMVVFSQDPPDGEANKPGDVWFQYDANEDVVGQWRGLGGFGWQQVALSHQVISSLDAAKITVGKIVGEQIEAGEIRADHLSSVIALISKIASSETGRRWEADSDGIRLYGSDGTILVNFPTDPNQPASILGDFVATSLTVTDQLAIRGLVNEISKGAQVMLATGTTAPTSPPAVTVTWDFVSTAVSPVFDPYRVGLAWDGTDEWIMAQNVYNGPSAVQAYSDAGAVDAAGEGFGWDVDISQVTSTTVLGGIIYLLGIDWREGVDSDGLYYVEGWRISDGVRVSRWEYPHVFGTSGGAHRRPMLANDGANLVIAFQNYSNNLVQWRKFNPATGAQVGGVTASDLPVAKNIQAFTVAQGDFAAQRIILVPNAESRAYVISAAGAAQPNDYFFLPSASITGIGWDPVNNRFASHDSSAARLYRHTAINWGAETSSWWMSSAWYDPDAAGGTHQTAQGPRTPFTMKKRAKLRVTLPPLPLRPIPNTTDDATAQRVFIGRGASDPGRAKMEFQVTTSDTVWETSTVTLPAIGNNAATPPPSVSDFPASSPAKIISADGSKFVVQGDGSGQWGDLQFTAAGKTLGAVTVPSSRRMWFCGGAIRNTAGTFAFIDDSAHRPTGLGAITMMSDRIRIAFDRTATKVTTFVPVCDETFAAWGLDIGASVGTDYVDLFIYRDDATAIADYVSYSGTAWSSFNGVFTGISYNGAGVLTLTHEDMGTTGDQAVLVSARGTAAALSGGYGATTSQVSFYSGNWPGASPTATGAASSAQHRVYVMRKGRRVRTPVNPNTLVAAFGNFWLLGINEQD